MLFIVRYGEIAIKSNNVRRRFLSVLVENMRSALERRGLAHMIKEERGRIYLYADAGAADVLAHTFGVVSYSRASETSSAEEDIRTLTLEYASNIKEGSTFAVRCRRSGSHPYTSQELAASIGKAVLDERPDLKVDLSEPEAEIFIEVRNNRAYVFSEKVRGPGGLPVGTQGPVLCPATNEENTRAGLLLARRGCVPVFASQKRFTLPDKWLPHGEPRYVDDAPEGIADMWDYAIKKGFKAIVLPWGREEFAERYREIPPGANVFLPLVSPPPFTERMEVVE